MRKTDNSNENKDIKNIENKDSISDIIKLFSDGNNENLYVRNSEEDVSENENDMESAGDCEDFPKKTNEDQTGGSADEINISQSIRKGLVKTGQAGKRGFSSVFNKESMRDMFFGTSVDTKKTAKTVSEEIGKDDKVKEIGENTDVDINEEYADYDDELLFDKKRKRPIAVEAENDKKIFEIEYMITPEQSLDGYMLYYRNFIKKSNIKWTFTFLLFAAASMAATYFTSDNYFNYLLSIIFISLIVIKWLNSAGTKKNAIQSSEDVKNSTYKLSFYNSRIVIEESELEGDRVFNYIPITIRFEDIELKVIDYEEIYILIFKKDYIFIVPKKEMTESMNGRFKRHMENILGEDYHEFYDKNKKKRQSVSKDNNNEEKDNAESESE